MAEKVILAYSGGLDTSVIIRWLKYKGYSVIAFLADLGQKENFYELEKRAEIAGAEKIIVKDLREEFVENFVFPALQAEAHYQNYLLSSALSRPLIAKYLVNLAKELGANKVAHGCSGRGNDQIRFELSIHFLEPNLEVIAPLRMWEFKSREEELEFAKKEGIIQEDIKSTYSIDENIWGKSIECGGLEDIEKTPDDVFTPIEKNSTQKTEIEITFKEGIPTEINSKSYTPVKLVEELGNLGKKYGIGRIDMIEDRVIGIKTRELYEAPAATILYRAHQELEALTLDFHLRQFKQKVSIKYGELIYFGLWYTDLKEALDAFIKKTQRRVEGKVKLRLLPYFCIPISRSSVYSRYSDKLASYSKDFYLFKEPYAKAFIDFLALSYSTLKNGDIS